jgi:hypothetical protein
MKIRKKEVRSWVIRNVVESRSGFFRSAIVALLGEAVYGIIL